MTRRMQTTVLDEINQLLIDQDFDGLADAFRALLNEVMKLERAAALGAVPYRCSYDRKGYAIGFKPRIVQTRAGALSLAYEPRAEMQAEVVAALRAVWQ